MLMYMLSSMILMHNQWSKPHAQTSVSTQYIAFIITITYTHAAVD